MKPIVLVRWGVPIVIAAVGVYLIGRSAPGVGEAIIAAAICVVVANVLLRVGFADQRDRDREEEAREFYDEHGYWPDERPPGPR